MKDAPRAEAEAVALARKWLAAWKLAAPELERQRRREVRATDTVQAMQLLDDAFESGVWLSPPRPTSGLVEQQAVFARSRR